MSEIENVAEQQTEVEVVDYKALYEKTKADLDTVAAHKDKLYQETKEAKTARDKAAAETKRIEQEKAIKDGEFEKLFQTKSKEVDEYKTKLENTLKAIRQDKLHVSAMRISQELAEGDNAELLSDFVVRNLDKMADENGSLSDDVLEAVKKEFAGNQKYKALLRGSKASGGDAAGNAGGKAAKATITRAEFDSMNSAKRVEFSRKIKAGQASLVD